MEHFVLLIPAFTWHQVFEKCLLTSGGLFMSQWFFLWTPVCFFFISLTFPCICEGANDSLTGMLSGRWCLSNGGASALYWVLVCVSVCVCVEKAGVLSGRDRHTLHVLLETGASGRALVHDSCLSSLSSLHLTPDRPSLLPLAPHPLLFFPPSLSPPRLTSSHGASLGRPEWWTAKASRRLALCMWWWWCAAAGLSQA